MSFTLQYYCESGDLDMVNDRLEEGEDPDEFDENGLNALHYACNKGHYEIVDVLLDANADTMLPDKKTNRLAIHWSCINGNVEIVKLLLERGSNPYNENLVELKDPDGMTPIMVAASSGSTDVVIYLKDEKNAKINSKSKNGKTPLHYAAEKGQEGATLALLARGCNSHLVDENGDQALILASRNRFLELSLQMCERGCYAPCAQVDKALNRTSRVIKDKTKKFERKKPKEDKRAKRRAARDRGK